MLVATAPVLGVAFGVVLGTVQGTAFGTVLGALPLSGLRPGLLIFELNLSDWGFILLANLIIFGLLGKKLAADVRGWMAALGVGATGRPASAPREPGKDEAEQDQP
jgi:hypothetical protein